VENIDFWVDFVAEHSNKLQKLGLEGKNQLSPWCVHIVAFLKSHYENVNNKNVFTPRPTAQGTLVSKKNLNGYFLPSKAMIGPKS